MVAASGQLGSVARHQIPQSDIPSLQGLHRLEPFQESLTGRHSLKTPRGSKSIAGGNVRWVPAFDVNLVILGGQIAFVVGLLVLRSIIKARRRRFS